MRTTLPLSGQDEKPVSVPVQSSVDAWNILKIRVICKVSLSSEMPQLYYFRYRITDNRLYVLKERHQKKGEIQRKKGPVQLWLEHKVSLGEVTFKDSQEFKHQGQRRRCTGRWGWEWGGPGWDSVLLEQDNCEPLAGDTPAKAAWLHIVYDFE